MIEQWATDGNIAIICHHSEKVTIGHHEEKEKELRHALRIKDSIFLH